MKKVIILNKKEGETPLQALEFFRQKHQIYKYVKMTYAGRLDPMASGLLLVLSGEQVKNKEKYLTLDKEYNFEILFGFATDTYDILGKITKNYNLPVPSYKLQEQIKKHLKSFQGRSTQKYPMYSSKTVKGKQLFEYARKGIAVEVPEREIFVKELKFLKLRKINNKKLLENIQKRIKNVTGDFRQVEILKLWRKKLEKSQSIQIANFKIKCSSGTYVRGIANSLGEQMGIPALAFSIQRTKLGKWSRI